MQLSALKVKHFRGVRKAELSFSETSLLIGENNCGKTSLLDAISLALSVNASPKPFFERRHFYWPANGDQGKTEAKHQPIAIELVFVEKRPGEWRRAETERFDALAGGSVKRPRSLSLWLEADPPGAGVQRVPARWRIGPTAQPETAVADDVELLAELRRFNPLIELRGCPLTASAGGNGGQQDTNHRHQHSPAGSAIDGEANVDALHRRVERHFRELISGGTRDRDADLQAGFEAAEALLEHLGIHLSPSEGLTQAAISELLGESSRVIQQQRQTLPTSSVQRMGVLIFTAVVLRHLPLNADRVAWPILIIEDPEAHLHRMTLASLWGLLASVDAQKIITSQSPALLSGVPLSSLRRLVRHHGEVHQRRVRDGALEPEDQRKIGYHLRARRGDAMFARAWILVEGETEFWVVNELARLAGHDFDLEGIACVEFAQCGLSPLIRIAHELGIEWHLLADGDVAGRQYVERARALCRANDDHVERITRLAEGDLEQCFYQHGYAEVFQRLAGRRGDPGPNVSSRQIIQQAVARHAKPDIALQLMMAAGERGSRALPPPLAEMIDRVVDLARRAPERLANSSDTDKGRRT